MKLTINLPEEIYKKIVDEVVTISDFDIICQAIFYHENEETERPHGGWIPCSAILPGSDKRILFCDTDGDVYCGKKYYGGAWCDDRLDDRVKNVVAWMPLPEPYKEGGDLE